MEDSQKQSQILNFLKKNYIIFNDIILDRNGHQFWGKEILRKLPIIFSEPEDYCEAILVEWAKINGIDNIHTHVSYTTKQLKTTWNPEMAQEIAAFQHIDVERELIRMLSDQLAQEIDAQILKDLKHVVEPDEFMNLVKCVGYTNYTIYDQSTFKPRKIFASMKKQDIEHERQNNPHWQDWIRTREQDKET